METYVVRGLVAQNTNYLALILVGWINADIKRKRPIIGENNV